MSNKLVMRIAALLCLLAGFAIGMNIFGLKDRSYSVKEGDSFYSQPSVTAQPAAGFAKGEELDVTDKLELAAPTAVKVLQTKIVEDKNRTKYQLREGDVYKLVESRMDKANTPCVIEVQTVEQLLSWRLTRPCCSRLMKARGCRCAARAEQLPGCVCRANGIRGLLV